MNSESYSTTASDSFRDNLENHTISSSSRAQSAGNNSYYRSKTFTSTTGINPIITAASPLLAMISRLRVSHIEDSSHLYQDLVHEIKAFENAVQTQGYRSEITLVARYVLCATLDETILGTAWSEQSEWESHKLLTTFQNDSWGGDRFFFILDRISEDPAQHIELLELMYMCLSLGFKGKYRHHDRGEFELEEIKETLYQHIRKQRGEFKKELCELPRKRSIFFIKKPSFRLPLWLVAVLAIFTLLTVYIGLNFMLDLKITPLSNELTHLLQETNSAPVGNQ